jgi:hypothetical protein
VVRVHSPAPKTLAKSTILDVGHIKLFISQSAVQVPSSRRQEHAQTSALSKVVTARWCLRWTRRGRTGESQSGTVVCDGGPGRRTSSRNAFVWRCRTHGVLGHSPRRRNPPAMFVFVLFETRIGCGNVEISRFHARFPRSGGNRSVISTGPTFPQPWSELFLAGIW